MKILSYAKLLKKCNTMKNEIDTLQTQHENDVKDKIYLSNEVKKLKAQMRDLKKEKKTTKKTKTKKGE